MGMEEGGFVTGGIIVGRSDCTDFLDSVFVVLSAGLLFGVTV